MKEDSSSDETNQSSDNAEYETPTRRTLLRSGGVGAALLGIGGYAGTASATRSQHEPPMTPVSDRQDVVVADGGPEKLLQRNQIWNSILPEGYFSDVQQGQAPPVTSVCCSDSRVSQEGMFLSFFEAGYLFKPSNIGNKVISIVDGERVVNGNFLYGLEKADSESGVVVGHTGCGAITAAYESVTGNSSIESPGISQEVEVLLDIVKEGLDSDLIDTTSSDTDIINQLVEYNVNQQVEFLVESDEVSAERDLYGFVYDFQEVYGDVPGKTYLVNVNGETNQDKIRAQLPSQYEDAVKSLLY
ncbi:carbonic anhydrase [Halococcus salsus]|uniref:carbonic anhydrase n=1 Tax=Halococcus salsus TaxID=2162894 RepID=UPI00135CB41F|nr:carbonic anhydrase [Halococcus salsus]